MQDELADELDDLLQEDLDDKLASVSSVGLKDLGTKDELADLPEIPQTAPKAARECDDVCAVFIVAAKKVVAADQAEIDDLLAWGS